MCFTLCSVYWLLFFSVMFRGGCLAANSLLDVNYWLDDLQIHLLSQILDADLLSVPKPPVFVKGDFFAPLSVLLIQIKCFQEIIHIGYAVYHVHKLPWFRSLSWYFLITSNYFFYGLSMIDYFEVLLRKDQFLRFLVVHHRFISFVLYVIGFIWFVLSLVKHYYMRQFSLFAWTHVTLLLIVSQSYLIIQNTFQGIICVIVFVLRLIVPVSMIICNDISAYIFGFFFGRTPLIKISPKKTWEGFLGGAVCTVIFGFGASDIKYFFITSNRVFSCPMYFCITRTSYARFMWLTILTRCRPSVTYHPRFSCRSTSCRP
ncbi:unnamed protein product [Soboliphyme baturini]|uniref:phosphatidate cytidylyltransferase n=1 Tax=Soboliphyme baturini TaxID=241478 RepID=A0A183J908_9BILA|nr:unnamed protein product [Soboliphyme baturini]